MIKNNSNNFFAVYPPPVSGLTYDIAKPINVVIINYLKPIDYEKVITFSNNSIDGNM